ncbi:MAG TPA: alpha/beta hydrolase-fold protein [Thermoguttaceae bacterium]|nr:alpha/beta hydrolase-fold protein [Thermoguttaceae bacterium]
MKPKRSFPLSGRVFLILICSAGAHSLAAEKQAAELTARHQAGQTLLCFREVDPPVMQDAIPANELATLRRDLDSRRKIRYRIYRSDRPITSVASLTPVAEVPPLTGWNADYHGIYPKPGQMALRYVVEEGKGPVPPGTGICAHNPPRAGDAYYAVTVAIDGKENTALNESNSLRTPVSETVGRGVPVLQRIEKPEQWQYVEKPTLHYYVRWESPPNCAASGKPYDYVVAVPPKLAKPAGVGIHLHCWGGSLDGGYGWWYQAEQGHLLVASNQIPYDWWTGYHERYFQGPPDEETWKQGVVRPYSQTRMLSFLDWVATQWDVDLTRTHVAGNSMGGSGSLMFAIRHGERIAWATGWVGVHIPSGTPHFKGSYERVYGKEAWGVEFENGTPVWVYFNDAWYLRNHPQKEIGLICFSNGKNDGGIGWPQAAEFYRALQETRRPHIFVWGQSGHGQRARLPISTGDHDMPMDLRTDQSLPAFTGCSLDDDPGGGDPKDGDSEGQVNLYLYWKTDDIVDRVDRWEMTLGLIEKAPQDQCTVNVTPRRLQQLRLQGGQQVDWTNTPVGQAEPIQTGRATADRHGLITLEKVRLGKTGNRVMVQRAAENGWN